ncbi:uncharacterized protein LOC111021413 isoform X2 [Momordica charantia]|uniref:Uncharacterized protein LOC111021413 isoform X2 n=1 Tax=Momordica charantia TaxID=3673 RepID=A0A6J1DML2_MOMCH|nr:uncharacterized protein LOC111021413 isoform X2 [Momordica charantia]
MDKYLVPSDSTSQNPKPLPRNRWKLSNVELNGKFDPKYRQDLSVLLMQSYTEVGAFPHLYHIDGIFCPTSLNRIANRAQDHLLPFKKQGISAVDFDNKGIYLVSVTKTGCLTVHDFESLYFQTNEAGSSEDEIKHLLHLSLKEQLDFVRWNPANQDEVVCTSMKSKELRIFDIGYISSKPVEVLRARQSINNLGTDNHKGLSDIAFISDNSRLLASDTCGGINMWDRRIGTLPCLELTSNSCSTLNRIQLNVENQIIFGSGKHGIIYIWDLRGGRTSGAFQNHKEVCHPPLKSLKLASMIEKIGTLKEQANIIPKEIHSIDLNPACPYQLAFHLDDGWSGILDVYNFQVTHIHCPPPAWLNDSNMSSDQLFLRKPSWLPTDSVSFLNLCFYFVSSLFDTVATQCYIGIFARPELFCQNLQSYSTTTICGGQFFWIFAVGSSSDEGIHLLDFHPDSRSPSHVDYNDDLISAGGENKKRQNRFVKLSEGVTSCAAHPLNGTIIAGTKNSSLIMISQKKQSI